MFGYYLYLAWRSLRRSQGLTALMMLAIGFGVAASMTTYAVFRGVSVDPIPWKSSQLFVPQIDMWGPAQFSGLDPRSGAHEPPDALDYADAMALMRDHRAKWQSAIYAVAPTVLPAGAGRSPIPVFGFGVCSDFFPMLDVPFQYGSGWDARSDPQGAPVIVISDALNREVFGGDNSVGRGIDLDGKDYRVIGVMKPWNPQPMFFDVVDTGGFGGDGPQVFVPLQRALASGMANAGAVNCPKGVQPGAGADGLQESNCAWLAYMIELDDAAAVQKYRQYLDNYAREQQKIGRFAWPPNNRLRDMRAFLDAEHVVPDDTHVSLLVALGLLLVCLINTVGLLLAKFLRRSGEIGVRRALGASRRAIHAQFLTEAAVVGVGGGVLGLLLTAVGVAGVNQVLPPRLAELARIDPALLVLAVAVAVAASLLAGVYPTFRAARVQPAWQLKTN
ncbi:ABC transporter permease [Rhodanobacter ginsengisoli]|uniref:ABC transporter permease n=1 Tax=Rhodanobacter ginsengisoli TaxID=418646 RepID=A0ABW0QQD0_9GAMM